MKYYISILLLLFISCHSKNNPTDIDVQLQTQLINNLQNQIEHQNKEKMEAINICYSLGFRRGVHLGVHNADSSYRFLNDKIIEDSIKFLKFADSTFK